MFLLCICIVYVRYVFLRERFADFFNIEVLSTSVPMYLHCIHSLHILKAVSDFLDPSKLYALVYIHYTYLGGFPICFYCVCLSI